jgi:uncharacterized protein DUF4440
MGRMRGLVIAITAAALFTGVVLLAFSPDSPARGRSAEARRSRTERRAEALLARLDRAMEQRNAGRLHDVLHRDFIAVAEDGAVLDRDAFVRSMTTGSFRERHQVELVRGGRRTIVAVGQVIREEPARASAARRFSAVMVRVDDEWKISGLHTGTAFAATSASRSASP